MSNLDTITHYINGVTVDTQSGRYADVFNPALGEPVARVAWGRRKKSTPPCARRKKPFRRGPPRRR